MASCPLCYVTGKGCPAQDYISQHHLLLNVVLLLLLMNEMGVTVVCVTYGACLRVTFVCLSLACLPSDPLSHCFPDLLILQRTGSCKLQFPRLPALALTRFSQPGHWQDTVGREPG